jgi:hypothetical protein
VTEVIEVVHICGPHLSVPGKTECIEAVDSQGRACRKCDHPSCYRRGWTAEQATADNARRVETRYKGRDANAPVPTKIAAMRFICHLCGKTTKREWKNVKRRWPKCCGQLMSETAIATAPK